MGLLINILSLLLANATTPATKIQDCLSEPTIKNSLRNIASLDNSTPLLLQKECQKRRYKISNTRQFIIYYNSKSEIKGTIQDLSGPGKSTAQCLSRAEKDIGLLDISWANKVLSKSKALHDWRWQDPHIGPHAWLNCDTQKGFEYYSSLATFLHELNHNLSKENCIYSPQIDNFLCFTLDKDLPLRGIAKVDNFGTTTKALSQRLSAIQDLYMDYSNKPPFFLFGELNSYILSNSTYSRVLEKKGQEIFIYRNYLRAPSMVPLFAFYTVNYLNQLKIKSPKKFKRNFISHKSNRTNIKRLLSEAKKSHHKWTTTLKNLNMPVYDYETAYWKKFEIMEKGLKL